jgi:hypothetical protein
MSIDPCTAVPDFSTDTIGWGADAFPPLLIHS